MAEVVNLRRARKARDRSARETTAAASRVAHGRTRAERAAASLDTDRAERVLDGGRLDRDGNGG